MNGIHFDSRATYGSGMVCKARQGHGVPTTTGGGVVVHAYGTRRRVSAVGGPASRTKARPRLALHSRCQGRPQRRVWAHWWHQHATRWARGTIRRSTVATLQRTWSGRLLARQADPHEHGQRNTKQPHSHATGARFTALSPAESPCTLHSSGPASTTKKDSAHVNRAVAAPTTHQPRPYQPWFQVKYTRPLCIGLCVRRTRNEHQ